jgi:hypothetical protein
MLRYDIYNRLLRPLPLKLQLQIPNTQTAWLLYLQPQSWLGTFIVDRLMQCYIPVSALYSLLLTRATTDEVSAALEHEMHNSFPCHQHVRNQLRIPIHMQVASSHIRITSVS